MILVASNYISVATGALGMLTPEAAQQISCDTRRKRRKLVDLIITQLETIKEYEHAYMVKIPENLQTGAAYENAELAIDSLEQAIELLSEAY